MNNKLVMKSKFNAGDNKEYKVEAIQDSLVYASIYQK